MGVVYGICGETKAKREVEAKTQVVNFTSSITIENNTIYRALEDISSVFSIGLPGCNDNDVFSCELQFKTGADVTKIGIYHPFNDVRVTGIDFIETVTDVDYYSVDGGTVYDILIWYGGQTMNVAVI